MASTTLATTDPVLKILEQERQDIWQRHSHLSEEERLQLWNGRRAAVASYLNDDVSSRYPQEAHIPRTVSYGGWSARQTLGLEIPNPMNRIEGYSSQSAPAAVSLSRSPSSHSAADDAGALMMNARSRSMMSDWQTTNEEPSSAYTLSPSSSFGRSQSFLLSITDTPDWVDTFPSPSTLSAAPLPRELIRNDSNRLSASYATPCTTWSTSMNGLTTPSTPTSTGELTTSSTWTSDMSRQNSFSTQFVGDFSTMMRVNSSYSNVSDFISEQSVPSSSSDVKNIGLPDIDRSFLSFTGPISEDVSPLAQFSLSPLHSFENQSVLVEDMKRSTSKESNKSTSTSGSRHSRRHKEQLAQGSRPILPKEIEKHNEAVTRQATSNVKMLRVQSEDGSSRDVAAITKSTYTRPTHPKIMCPHCNESRDGFRGDHELRRHTERAHARVRKYWVTVDASVDKKFLASCKQCRNGKKYGAYYNAAAHLRRAHFHPRKRGRKGKHDEKRGGKGGGDDPPMEYLKQNWMQEVEVIAEEEPAQDQSDDSAPEQLPAPTNPNPPTYLDIERNAYEYNTSYPASLSNQHDDDFMTNPFTGATAIPTSFDTSYDSSQPNNLLESFPDDLQDLVANPDDAFNSFQFEAQQQHDDADFYMHHQQGHM
ncbi:hypothetical protein K432DRAFT_423047 [Lepidopterella palustris CBS 459.81]|uniref:DUF7896 domain-containing protein n=1 Tax=Lepidopterella palustris CBS 459.81 TaxID=1314670 RepID=A0A8E2JIM7_9PEZI|nr:hypothetical protein K432DRAFT_423047 [Lepidopterella palustris CBS 459.81]